MLMHRRRLRINYKLFGYTLCIEDLVKHSNPDKSAYFNKKSTCQQYCSITSRTSVQDFMPLLDLDFDTNFNHQEIDRGDIDFWPGSNIIYRTFI